MGAAHPCLYPAELSQALSFKLVPLSIPPARGLRDTPPSPAHSPGQLYLLLRPGITPPTAPPRGLGVRWSLRTTPHLSTDDSGDDEDGTPSPADKSELHGTIKSLSLKLDDLSTCNELVAKHGVALQRSLNELDGLRIPAESSEKLKAVNERATLFRITSNAMINVSAWAHGRGHLLPRGWSGLPLPAVRLLHVTPSTPLGPGQVAGPHCQVEPGAGRGAWRALQAWAQEAVLSGAVSSVPTAGMRLPHCPNTAAAHPPFSSAQPRRGVSGTPDQGG